MNLTCPACRASASVDAWATDAHIFAALQAAARLPEPVGNRVFQYLALFRPASGNLKWEKMGKLLTGLAEAIKAAQIDHKGKTYAAPLQAWTGALDIIIARPPEVLPLKSHGYLWAVIASSAERIAEAKEEHKRKTRVGGNMPGKIMDRQQQEQFMKSLRIAAKAG